MTRILHHICIAVAALVFASTALPVSAAVSSSTLPLTVNGAPFVLAVEKDYPPFLFDDNGTVRGITYEFFELIAKTMGRRIETTPPLQLSDLIDAVKAGKANVVIDITKTADRSTFLSFSDPFVQTPAVIIERSGRQVSWDGSKFAPSTTVAVGKGYGVEAFLKQHFPKVQLVELNSDRDVIRAVALGATDTGVLDAASLTYLLQREPMANISVTGQTGFEYALSVAVPKNQEAILLQINEAIATITPAEKTAIFSHWLTPLTSTSYSRIWWYGGIIAIVFFSILSIALLWVVALRRSIASKTKELSALTVKLDNSIHEKEKEFAALQIAEQKKTDDLQKTKQAILNILEDVQKEKNNLARVTNRLTIATESAQIGVFEVVFAQNKMYGDAHAAQLYGLPKKDFIFDFDDLRALIHPDDLERVRAKISDAIQNRTTFEDTYRVRWSNGSVHFLRAYAQIENDDSGQPARLVGVNFDVTKEMEIDQAKSEFISLASHQLRTPLSAINWYTEMLQTNNTANLTPDQRRYIDEIYASNQRMINLVNALLNVSRIDMGTFFVEPEVVYIDQLTKSLLVEFQPRIVARSLTVEYEVDPMIPELYTDPKILRIILQNIISNALKYSHDNGEVIIHIFLAAKNSFVGKRHMTEESLAIAVADTGVGIPIDQHDKIFTKLFRADNVLDLDIGGTGLGLYIVKSIVDRSGGTIWFDSTEGMGTIFYVTFPLGKLRKNNHT